MLSGASRKRLFHLFSGVDKIGLNEILQPVKKELEKIEKLLKKTISSDYEFINDAGEHLFSGGGKRLRPAILLLCSKLFNGGKVSNSAIDASISVELVHAATLVHDDIIDNASMRRGRESLNHKFGSTVSVLFGDYLYCKAFMAIKKHEDEFVAKNLLEAASSMCEGEIYQNLNGFNADIKTGDYIDVIQNKTARFISKCCAIGAHCGGADGRGVSVAEKFGLNLGIAFQIADDILDIASSCEVIGKPVGNDLIEGKITLPVLMLLERLDSRRRDELKSAISSKNITSSLIKEIRKMAFDLGTIEDSRKAASDYGRAAALQLKKIKTESLFKDSLIGLCDYVVERKY